MGVFRWSGPIHYKGGDWIEKLYFIGIDVHKTTCVATIKGRAKKILKQTSFDNDIQGMTGFIKMIRESKYVPATVVYESTGNYWWVLYDTLREAGINALVAHPYHTKIITEAAYKDDVSDSEKLADLGRADMVPESFVADKPQRDLRELTRTRLGLKQNSNIAKHRIHAILAKYPHKRPACGSFTGPWLEWLRRVPLREIDRMAVDSHMAILAAQSKEIAKFERRIVQTALDNPRARLIMTIPGIGHILAVTVLAEIVDHKRFANAEKLTSYRYPDAGQFRVLRVCQAAASGQRLPPGPDPDASARTASRRSKTPDFVTWCFHGVFRRYMVFQ